MYVRGVTALLALQEAVKSMQRDLYHYEGTVRQFLIDDKGSVMIGVFGIPPKTHEDEAHRAILASMQLQKNLLENVQIQCRVGVTTGQAFVGDVGNEERREYAMVGDIVNLSARLMVACPWGEIRCDSTTYKAACNSIHKLDFEKLDPIKVKGKEDPIEIYRPIQDQGTTRPRRSTITATTESQTHQVIIGRQNEMKQLRRHMRAVFDKGKHRIIIIQAEAGQGKTRLVNELRWHISGRRKSLIIYKGVADSIEKSPFFIWKGIVFSMFNLGEYYFSPKEEHVASITKSLTDWFNHHEPESSKYLSLFGTLLGIKDWPESDEVKEMSQQKRIESIHSMVISLLQKKCNVLILENAQWMDVSSWGLVLTVSQKCKSLLMIMTTRFITFPLPVELVQIQREKSITFTLKLPNLNEQELIEIVKQRINVKLLPTQVEEMLINKIKQYPNPLLAQETADLIKEKGLLETNESGEIVFKSGIQLDQIFGSTGGVVPSSLRGIFTAKIDRLTQSQQLILKFAAVIGRSFPLTLVHDLLPIGVQLVPAKKLITSASKSNIFEAKDDIENEKMDDTEYHKQQDSSDEDEVPIPKLPDDENDYVVETDDNKKKTGSQESLPDFDTISGDGYDSKRSSRKFSPRSTPVSSKRKSDKKKRKEYHSGSGLERIRLKTSQPDNKVPSIAMTDNWESQSMPVIPVCLPSTPTSSSSSQSSIAMSTPKLNDPSSSKILSSTPSPESESSIVTVNNNNDDEECPSPTTFNTNTPTSTNSNSKPDGPSRSISRKFGSRTLSTAVINVKMPDGTSSPLLSGVIDDEEDYSQDSDYEGYEEDANNNTIDEDDKQSTTPEITRFKYFVDDSGTSKRNSLGNVLSSSPPIPIKSHRKSYNRSNSNIVDELLSENIILREEVKRLKAENSKLLEENNELKRHSQKNSKHNATPTQQHQPHAGPSTPLLTLRGTLTRSSSDTKRDQGELTTNSAPSVGSPSDSNPQLDFKSASNGSLHTKVRHLSFNSPLSRTFMTDMTEEERNGYQLTTFREDLLNPKSQNKSRSFSIKRKGSHATSIANVSTSSPNVPELGSLFPSVVNRKPDISSGSVGSVGGSNSSSQYSPPKTITLPKLKVKSFSPDTKDSFRSSPSMLSLDAPQTSRSRLTSSRDLNANTPVSPPPIAPPPPPEETSEEKLANENAAKEMATRLAQLKVIIKELEELGTIKSENTSLEGYQFTHTLLREVLQETILPSERKSLHEKIAIWFELNPSLTESNMVARLAYHWRKAEKPDKAINFYAKAAEITLNDFQHKDAIRHLVKAIDLYNILYSSNEVKEESNTSVGVTLQYNPVKWHRQLAECYYNLGNMDKAIIHLDTALDILKEPNPNIACVEMDVVFPTLLQYSLLDDSVNSLSHGKDKSKSKAWLKSPAGKRKKDLTIGDMQEIIRIMLCYGQVHYYLCNTQQLTYCTLLALNMAEQIGGVSSELRRALWSGILASSIQKSTHFGLTYNKLGKVLFKDDWKRRSKLYLGLLRSGKCEWKKADSLYEKSAKYAEQLGDRRTCDECFLYLIYNKIFQGKFNDALENSVLLLRSARSRGDIQMQVLSLVAQANIFCCIGETSQFKIVIDEIEAYCAEGVEYKMETLTKIHYHSLLAIKLAKENRIQEAHYQANLVEKLVRNHHQPTVYFSVIGIYHALMIYVLILLKTEDWVSGQHKTIKQVPNIKKFVHQTSKMIKILEDFGHTFAVAVPCYYIVKGIFEESIGGKRGSSYLKQGIESSRELGMKYFEAVTHHWIGMSSTSIRDTADIITDRIKHKDIAAEWFAHLGVQEGNLLWSV
eukprot:TRINITY_DN910_c1_g1_i1.p1 TRINITY_DN910_c1_g1~~TRINITY_DN910_c1_g1_i1.p1  ORF type:complete len:2117 (+),score=467.99 TRINITY_DN910_c1_g1_i1:912-6353(+)